MEREVFGRYELVERIGVGGMAEVFKAVQRGVAGFERVVAIKRILPSIAADPEIVRMFIEEAKLAVQLSHAGIAQVFDLGRVGDAYFIAMEYVEGASLLALWERWTARGARLPLAAVCHIVSQVADALHYAHFAQDGAGRPLGIIHRDVSPGNVLISLGGEVKVIDFGLAKAENRVSQTGDGIVKGKLAYLSPEQAHGRPIDRRSDIFSLGVCAWELLTGRRAFKRDDDRETVLAIRRGAIDPPSRFAPVPPALERIVMRTLAPSLADRYRTALELRDDLEAFVRAAQLPFGKRELAALVRETFPERFAADEPAFALVREKRPASSDAITLDEELEATDPVIDLVKHDPFRHDAADTEPNIVVPHERPR
ncbi:MAG TPA: serine/threonine-protein kinase [Sandaracinaceae bacterium]